MDVPTKRQAEEELGHTYAHGTRGEKVPALVNEHEHGEHEQAPEYGGDDIKWVHEYTNRLAGALCKQILGGYASPCVDVVQLLEGFDPLDRMSIHRALNDARDIGE